MGAFKKAESNAEKEQEKFKTLFENSTIGIVATNAFGQITLLNRFAEKQFGYKRDELTGKEIEILIPRAAAEKHVQYRQAFVESPQNRPMGIGMDLRGQRKNGTTFPVEVSLGHYKTSEGTFIVAFVNDITIRKKHEHDILEQKEKLKEYAAEVNKLNRQLEQRVEERTLALREALQQLERSKEELEIALNKEKELSDLKSRFVSMASHEFRTPLSTILSSSSLIEKYKTESEQEKRERHVNRIKENVKNLTDILEDFLSLGKLEEGLIQPKFTEINIPQFIADIVHDMNEVKKPLQELSYSHEGGEQFMIDKHLLKNIIINLASNAIKFSDDDGHVRINSSLEENNCTISISDHGIGISVEDQQHLFDRFFRGRNAANIKGTGLGLHIVSKYMELLRGDISCNSKLNEGTTFTVTFTNIRGI